MRFFVKALLLLAFLSSSLFADYILYNEGIISKRLEPELNKIGSDLYKQTKIKLLVAAAKDVAIKDLLAKIDTVDGKVVLLALSLSSHQVNIIAKPKELYKLFNKQEVLSPIPSEGSILPILTSRKGKDVYNAAILNGYADISERIASSLNVDLKDGIGNANRITLDILRAIFYGVIILALIVLAYSKLKRKAS